MFCPDSCDGLISCMVAMWSESTNLNVIPLDTMTTYVMLHLRSVSSIVNKLKYPLQAEMRWATKFRQVKGKLSRHNTEKLRLQWAGSRLFGWIIPILFFESEIWDPVWRNMLDLLTDLLTDYSAIWWTLSWSSQNQFSCDLGLLNQDPQALKEPFPDPANTQPPSTPSPITTPHDSELGKYSKL